MLAYCANPSCRAPLHSFAEGRLFQFEVVSISISASDDRSEPFDEKPERQTAQFWLCGACASTMTLVLEPQKGLALVPLSRAGVETHERTEVSGDLPNAGDGNNC